MFCFRGVHLLLLCFLCMLECCWSTGPTDPCIDEAGVFVKHVRSRNEDKSKRLCVHLLHLQHQLLVIEPFSSSMYLVSICLNMYNWIQRVRTPDCVNRKIRLVRAYHKRAICSYGWKLCSLDSKVLLIHTQSRYCSVIRFLLCEEAFRDSFWKRGKSVETQSGRQSKHTQQCPARWTNESSKWTHCGCAEDGTTWGALPVSESHPLHPSVRINGELLLLALFGLPACLQLPRGQSPLIAETDNCVLLFDLLCIHQRLFSVEGGSGKCTQPESLWQRAIWIRWSANGLAP